MTKRESSKQIFLLSVAWAKRCVMVGLQPSELSDEKYAVLNHTKYSANQSWDLLILYVRAVVR